MADAAVNPWQAAATEAYRRSPYPPLIHPLTHPDRLATIARLAGMDAPDIRTARVLEIGVGDGLNTLTMAQTLPDASFVGFDIEPESIGRGRERLTATGLANVRLEVADLLDGATAIEGAFDYIIAHGVYAWVPEPVGDALLALMGARLSPHGVAFVSFNALPGCHSRLPLRDAMLRASAGAADDAERLQCARAILTAMAEPREHDDAVTTGLRAAARARLEVRPEVLLHDELGAAYRPAYLRDVLERAHPVGLQFLGDASVEQLHEALLADDSVASADRQARVERRAIVGDDVAFRAFRRLLLVRSTTAPSRVFDPRIVEGLFAASTAVEEADYHFVSGSARIRAEHPTIVALLRRLIAARPARVPVAELGLDDDALRVLVDLFNSAIVSLHTIGTTCATTVPEHPAATPLARAVVGEGLHWVPNLDHRMAELDAGAARAVAMLDGQFDRATVTAMLEAEGIDPDIVFTGLTQLAVLMP